MTRKLVHVAAAVIENDNGCIFLAKRPDDKHQGGLWEFPGGKVESGESPLQALTRELKEEVGLNVIQAQPLIRVPYHYSDKSVLLDVFHVSQFSGDAWGAEGQQTAWVSKCDLEKYDFPAANKPIVNAVLLSNRILITPECETIEQCIAGIEQAVKSFGLQAVMIRQPHLMDVELSEWYSKISEHALFKTGDVSGSTNPLQLIINSSVQLANQLKADAVHLSAARLAELDSRESFKGRWLSASCHDEKELKKAEDHQCDFVTLSPVQQTNSHPEAALLGWEMAEELISNAAIPVFLLGGLTSEDLERSQKIGAQGISAISAWWY